MGTLPECGIRTTALFSALSVGEELSAPTDPPRSCIGLSVVTAVLPLQHGRVSLAGRYLLLQSKGFTGGNLMQGPLVGKWHVCQQWAGA